MSKIDFSILLQRSNFDLSGLSPALKQFIYNEVANDRLPLGQIIKRAQSNANDRALIDIEFQRIKDQLPEIVADMPFEIKMIVQPLLSLLK